MKKGLNVTLMTVAIAVMALQAMAMAPVIGDIQSPIVGNEPSVTAATPFVFPDAFDITAKATDDTTAPANIRWSYYYTGTATYRINNVDPVAVNDAEINNPGAKRINGATTDPADVDGQAKTITIRNIKYAPIGGDLTDPTTTGIIDSQVITLFASDGTTYSSKGVIFYTDNGGNDRLSGEAGYPTVYNPSFPGTGTNAWGYEFTLGSVTSSTATNTAVCLDTAAAGLNFGGWRSPWGIVPVSKNTVYKIRAHVNGSQSTAGTVPFFDLVIDNYRAASTEFGYGEAGLNLYGGDFMILDNEGGANAPLTTRSGMDYIWYWCPAAINNTAFDAGSHWETTNATARAMEMQFRVLDVNNNGGITADNDSGSICLTSLEVQAIPYSALSIASTPAWSNTNLTSSNWTAGGVTSTAATYAGGVCTLTPTGAATGASTGIEYASAGPGDGVKTYTPEGSSSLVDDYPVVWEANTLYMVNFKLAAPDADSAANPFDIYWVGMDAATNEFIAISYVTNKAGLCATPKTGTAQDYVAFLYSHNVSTTSLGDNAKRLRPRAELGTVTTMVDSANTGKVAIHGVTVSKVTVN